MRPPISRRLLLEDFQDAPTWVGKIFNVLNPFMEQVVLLFNKNISFGDNIQARSFSTSFITDASYATGSFNTLKFAWTGTSLPVCVLITSVSRDDGAQILTSVGNPTWLYGNGGINVSYVPGLAASVKYNITFLAF